MKINERFAIERDSLNFIVVETLPKGRHPITCKIAKHAKTSSKFYPNLKLACLYVLKASTDVEMVETCLDSMAKATAEIVAAVENIKWYEQRNRLI